MSDLRIERGRATRERIVSAGRELFGERGYDATSIEAILDAAGVARGALYHHFPNKVGVFDAVLERVTIEAAETVAEAARAARDPVAALRAGCMAWLRMALEPAIQRIVLTDAPVVVGWRRWRELDEQHTLGGLRANLRRIAESGRLPDRDVDALAHMLLAAVNEAALLVARAPDPEIAFRSAQAAVETLIDRLVTGSQS
jgi:AcrR family transcriptional regulator